MSGNRVRWSWLRGMYLYTIFGAGAAGLGILVAPELTRSALGLPAQERIVSSGVVGSVYLAFALLSALGLRWPLRYAPVLLLQLCYKMVWLAAVIVPAAVEGPFPAYAILPAAIYASYVVGDLIAIPFSSLFASDDLRPR